tara:strand:+ start:243 stop:386 length:144 start_codon:yes stop_codon:yes gene_type:complete
MKGLSGGVFWVRQLACLANDERIVSSLIENYDKDERGMRAYLFTLKA